MTMLSEVIAIADECVENKLENVPVRQAWRLLAAELKCAGITATKQRSGWGRSHFADCNASGGNSGYSYTGVIGFVIGSQDSMVSRCGGQNSGSYDFDAENNECAFFGLDGEIYEVCGVTGSWSQWQGSSSSYSLKWRRFVGEIGDEYFSEIIDKSLAALESRRDFLRSRHQAGASIATRVIDALKAL
jgi:hypothetical protein